ncbi:MAG: hypothetical protein ACREOD_03685 [Candidatus Dormibacteria bacterium]
MNYQDFESSWYLGLLIASFFALMLVGIRMVARRVRRLTAGGDPMVAWISVGASIYTFLFILGLCLALLVGIVVLAGG